MVIRKKITARTSVKIEITFSAPLSLVLTKTFKPPPVIAPEAPSDLPPWSKQRTIMMTLVTSNIQSYHAIMFCSSFFRTRHILYEIKTLFNENKIFFVRVFYLN